MYYKIINKECKVFKELKELREKELKINEENFNRVKEKINLEFENYYGHIGQQNFLRVNTYVAFEFKDVNKIPTNTWKKYKEDNNFWVPDRRYKQGKEIYSFLKNGLKTSFYRIPFKILELDNPIGKFKLPFIEVCEDIIILFLDDKHEPKDKNIIEITRTEFYLILNKK